jgi:GNAT superfamily N-acetyltransferase
MEILEQSQSCLSDYARIPAAFEVRSVLALPELNSGLVGFPFHECPANPTFIKDYDAILGNHPNDWRHRPDIDNWRFLVAREDGQAIGRAAVIFPRSENLLNGDHCDLAVLWDIRVDPQNRRQGIGTALFTAALKMAAAHGCRSLKIETQNINVPACKFYSRQGCTLGAIDRFAYPDFSNEIQLLWYKDVVLASNV